MLYHPTIRNSFLYTNEHHDDWDDWTKFYEFVYNTTEHTDTNYTPYELVFGRKANLPQDIFKTKIEPVYNIEQYYFEMKYKLQKSNEIARENLIKAKNRRQQILNKDTVPLIIKIGDQVYLENENRKKLDPVYIGPFTVVSDQGPNCVIQNNTTKKTSTVHKNRLIKYTGE